MPWARFTGVVLAAWLALLCSACRGLGLAAAAGGSSAPGPAAVDSAPPAPPLQPVARIEGVSEYRLANGLRVLCIPDSGEVTINVSIRYWVGSRHERVDERGVAHLIEHLTVKGSAQRRDLPTQIRARGGAFNAETTTTHTQYSSTFSADPRTWPSRWSSRRSA